MKKYEEFFKQHADYVIRLKFYETETSMTVEDLYQAFKERLADENSNSTSEHSPEK